MFQLPVTTPPLADQIASAILTAANKESERRVQFHKSFFNIVWNHPEVSPATIVAALGTNAATYFSAAAESVRHIAEIAELSNIPLDDVLPVESRELPSVVTFSADGSATIAEPPPA